MAAFVPTTLFLLALYLQSFYLASSKPYIGVNLVVEGEKVPKPEATVKVLKSTRIEKVRLSGADAATIKALANTNIEIAVGVKNEEIPGLANPEAANKWVHDNVVAHYPASEIIYVMVGDEVVSSGDKGQVSKLVPAMENLQNALNAAKLGDKIKVTTVCGMSVVTKYDPPSAGAFDHKYVETMKAVLQLLQKSASPLMVSAFPYYAYKKDPTTANLEYCLFQGKGGTLGKINSEHVDPANGNKYTGMYPAMLDAVKTAINALGFKDVRVYGSATGWPVNAHEPGATPENASQYNKNLIKFLESKTGTALMPNKPVDTFMFSLYEDRKKPGFALFHTDGSPSYDCGLAN